MEPDQEKETSGSYGGAARVASKPGSAHNFRYYAFYGASAVLAACALLYGIFRFLPAKEKLAKNSSQVQVYNSKYGVQAGPLGLENTNLTINAPHFTRKGLTYLVETNRYARTNELSWVLRPANYVDFRPNSEAIGKEFETDGAYLIPTLRINKNGTPVNGVYVSNSPFKTEFVGKQDLKDYGYGDQIRFTMSDPLVKVPINGTNYHMPDLIDEYGNTSVRIVRAIEDNKSFMSDGRRFLPGPVYELNIVSQTDYLSRSNNWNNPKTDAVEKAKPVNFGVVRED
jgi:hypothetical protein